MADLENNVRLFKVRVVFDNGFATDSYETIGLSERDLFSIRFALQLGFKVHIENITNELSK